MLHILSLLLSTFWLPVHDLSADQQRFLPETVSLQLSEEVIGAGETLWFQGILSGDSAESKVLYVELLNWQGAVMRGIYPIKERVAHGQLVLPDTLSGGWYQVRAYTQWMRNFGEASFGSRPLLVIDADENSTVTALSKVVLPTVPEPIASSPDDQIKITLNQTQFQPREKVSVQISLPDSLLSARVAVSVRKVHPLTQYFPTGAPASSPNQLKNTHRYEREAEGLTVSGTVRGLDKSTLDRAVVLSVPGRNPYFEYDLADPSGRFRIPIKEWLRGQQNMILQTADTSLRTQWSLDDKFAPENTYAPETFPEVPKEALTAMQQAYAQRERIHAQYDLFRPADSVVVSDQPDFRFYGAPNYTIRSEDYIELPNFVEVNRELMPGVRLRKNKGTYDLDVFDAGPRDFLAGEPTVFIDGVLMRDLNYLVSLPPGQIELIETVNRRTYYGEYRFDGTIAVYSTSGEAYLPALNASALRQPVTLYTPYQAFPTQDSLPAHEPDLRTLLYWEPAVEINHTPYALTIRNADELGAFEVVVEGVTQGGQKVRGRAVYKVSFHQ